MWKGLRGPSVGLIVLLAIIVVVVLSARSRAMSQRLICGSQLKGFGTACKLYADGSASDPAEVVAGLIRSGVLTAEQTHCPVSGKPYRLNLPAMASSGIDPSPQTIVAWEDPANHGGAGANVLYGDGHATFAPAQELESALRAQGLGN